MCPVAMWAMDCVLTTLNQDKRA
uniref:Uncharacterized protein n=1 Tax=Arundo donax TaxID=35708 RepID=A0A0A9HDL3_ARUDO